MSYKNFKTPYVDIKLVFKAMYPISITHFKTPYVDIKLDIIHHLDNHNYISKHHMLILNELRNTTCSTHKNISKHHMLILNRNVAKHLYKCRLISKHHMLILNLSLIIL